MKNLRKIIPEKCCATCDYQGGIRTKSPPPLLPASIVPSVNLKRPKYKGEYPCAHPEAWPDDILAYVPNKEFLENHVCDHWDDDLFDD